VCVWGRTVFLTDQWETREKFRGKPVFFFLSKLVLVQNETDKNVFLIGNK